MDLRDFGTVHAFVGCSVSTKASLAREVKRCSKSTLRRLIITADPLNRPSATLSSHHWYLHMASSTQVSPPCEGGVSGGGQGMTNSLGRAGNSAESSCPGTA